MFGEAKADCPFWRGACKEHKCRLYTQVVGTNPNTGEQINKFGCAFEFLPMLMIDTAKESRQTAASVDSFRSEMAQANGLAAVQMQIGALAKDEPKMLAAEADA